MSGAARLVAREHPDPHSFLGVHPAAGGRIVVRAYRPEARSVRVLLAEGTAVELDRVHAGGVFEAELPDPGGPPGYELEVAYPDGNTFVLRDPYSFAPTIGELDLELAGAGRHEELYRRLGAHVREIDGAAGVAFAVWAPGARAASVVGEFNSWDGRLHPMRMLGASGVWELFLPEVQPGARYKFELVMADGEKRLKADPFAFAVERAPGTDSIVYRSQHDWTDAEWMAQRERTDGPRAPMSIYEVHLESWRRREDGRSLTFAELADELSAYVRDMGFTHVELLPVMAHPFRGSWGYQVTSYFAPTPRLGEPDDLRALIDRLHSDGIGVILDWVPAHFPKDDWALRRFDGTALYEHDDSWRESHPDWGTLVFDFSRNEVRNFLIASALFWLEELHADGLRVDAVSSMLYLDYSREEGQWVPNVHGGPEDLEAVAFLSELNDVIGARVPGAVTVAEESTTWPGVSRPTGNGGLGFGFKWNMGWTHDTLAYFATEPSERRHHHGRMTFSLMYAFSERFVLPLSHDVVAIGSLLGNMPGDEAQRLANLRALYAYTWAHPGKKLLFMGSELAQARPWSHERALDWQALEDPAHAGVQALVRDLNRIYAAEPALWTLDHDQAGFRWLDPDDADSSTFAFFRVADGEARPVVCVCNLSPVRREGYRIGLPRPGGWHALLDTDAARYGGSGADEAVVLEAEERPCHGQAYSALLSLPALVMLWLVPVAGSPSKFSAQRAF